MAAVIRPVTAMTRMNLRSDGNSPRTMVPWWVRKLGITTATSTASSAPPAARIQNGVCQWVCCAR